MKHIACWVLLAFFLILPSTLCSQTPAWLWARTATSLNASGATYITTDIYQNSYVTGVFYQNMILGTDTLVNTGSSDAFIAKYDSAGNVLWARLLGSEWEDGIVNPSIDDGGNVYIAGEFCGSSLIVGQDTLVNQGPVQLTHDAFVVKYDSNGNVLWVRVATGSGREAIIATAIDGSDNLYISGHFWMSTLITFDSLPLYKVGGGLSNVFLAKYDNNGNVLWARADGGTNYSWVTGMATDPNGNIYITGAFDGLSITFGNLTLYNAGSLTDYDVFLVKYDPSGNVVWAQSFGGNGMDVGKNVATDQSGNVYITGTFTSPALSLGPFVLNNTGDRNVYVAKLDPLVNVLWAKSTGGTFDDVPRGLFVDETGGVYISVTLKSPSITFGNTIHYNLNPFTADFFIAKYDSLGNESWGMSIGGSGNEEGDISVSATGNLYIAGGYSSPAIVLGSDTLTTSAGTVRFFVAKASGFTGVESIRNPDYQISLYPNPMDNYVTVQVSSSIADLIFCLYDIHGRKMLSEKITETTRLDVSGLPAGIYIYTLEYPGGRQTGRLVKIH
jgi:hypothetical protein